MQSLVQMQSNSHKCKGSCSVIPTVVATVFKVEHHVDPVSAAVLAFAGTNLLEACSFIKGNVSVSADEGYACGDA